MYKHWSICQRVKAGLIHTSSCKVELFSSSLIVAADLVLIVVALLNVLLLLSVVVIHPVAIEHLDNTGLMMRPEGGALFDPLQTLQQPLRRDGARDGDLLLPLIARHLMHIIQVEELLLHSVFTLSAAQRHHKVQNLNIHGVPGLQDACAHWAFALMFVVNLVTVIGMRVEPIGAMDEVLSLVGIHGSVAWPHSVKTTIALHVRVASVDERLVWVNQIWIFRVRALEHWTLRLHDPCRLNWPIKQLGHGHHLPQTQNTLGSTQSNHNGTGA